MSYSSVRLLAIFFPLALAWSQSTTTGALSGAVTSLSGAAVAGATVTLKNPAISQQWTAATTGAGAYSFSLLPPGTYEVLFAAPGFKPARMAAVEISLSETPVLDATLEPGSAPEPLACQCRLSSASSATTTVMNSKAITAVPLTTRNLTQVLSMASGSAADVNNAGTLGRGTGRLNVNGNTSGGSYTLDGAYAPSAAPNPDTISELKIQTSQYDAVYGAQVPATALVTKSGDREYHGDAWEFVRNDIFNANSFFRNSTGQSKPNLKQNQFGGTLGGPVHKNRLFLFGSYQGTRQTNGLDTTSTSNTILPPLTADRSATALAAAFCPGNHADNLARYLTFAGGRQLDCANQSTSTTAPISPVALHLLQARKADGSYLIPIPQTILTSGSNAGLGFSSFSLPSTYHENQYLLNGDYLPSSRHTISARFYATRIHQFRTFGSPSGYPGTPTLPGQGTPQALVAGDYVGSLAATSSLTPNLVNEARFSVTHLNQDANGVDNPQASSVGMTAADPLFAVLPEINVLGPLGSFRLFGNLGNDFATENRYYSFADNLSWTRGSHRLHAGGFLYRQMNRRGDIGSARGKLTFQSFSDFLLGLSAADNLSPFGRSNIQAIQANEGVGQQGEPRYQYRTYYGAAYLQDDYKVSAHLTLDFGLRWEYVGPASGTDGTIGNAWPALFLASAVPPLTGTLAGNTIAANYNPNLINPYTGKPFGPAPEGVTVRSTSSFYRNSTPLDAFAPRFGFAWNPQGAFQRLAIRGGYGWFYQSPTFSGNAGGTPWFTSPPFAQGFTNSDASNNLSSLEKPFPTVTLGYIPRTPTSQLSDRVAGPDYTIPRLHQWNFSTKLRITGSLSLDLGYVGSRGEKLLVARGLNQPVLATASNPVNCGYDGNAAHCITTNTALNASLRVPVLGETPTALTASEFTGSSSYHSLQVTLRKQASRSLDLHGTYTFSRAAGNTSLLNDQNNRDLDWARASFDRTHRLTANFDYQLPSPVHPKSFAGSLLHGWTLAGIVILQSGLPMTLTDPNGGGVWGHAGVSTITLCPGATYASLATRGSASERLNGWIDQTAVCAPAAVGPDGATAYGTAGQSILNGPGQFNTDFSLGKTLRVGGLRESAILAFRTEFYNALNHSQFSNPGTSLGSASFGVITQNSVAPRLIQFALKYLF